MINEEQKDKRTALIKMFKGKRKKLLISLHNSLFHYQKERTKKELDKWEKDVVNEIPDYFILQSTFFGLIDDALMKKMYFEVIEQYEVCQDYVTLIELYKKDWLYLANKYYVKESNLTMDDINDILNNNLINHYKDEFGY